VRVARVQYGLTMSEGEARNIHTTYRRAYPGVKRYWDKAISAGRLHGYAETVAGRRIQLGTGDTWMVDNVWGLESAAINSPIQGSGADQKYLALAAARNYLPSVDGRFYYELHDGLFFIVPDRYAERAVVEMKQLLSELPYKKAWGKDLPILFPVDAKWGKSWGGLEEYK
jgi:DNA polymerase I